MDLREAADQISISFRARSRFHYLSSLFVKCVLVAGGSALATVAQFTAFEETGPTGWQIAGIVAAAVAGLGAIYVVIMDHDASADLDLARRAIDEARQLETEFSEALSDFDVRTQDLWRATHLYNAMSQMRGVLEQVLASSLRDEAAIIETLMKVSKRSLVLAMGFEQAHQWTICLYKAEFDDALRRTFLNCVSHNRAIECSVGEARRWPEGVGVSGVAFASRQEVIVPDLNDLGLGTTFELGSLRKDYDASRYRSLAAVPVVVNRDETPWGVVIATSDQPHHFYTGERSGVRAAEGVRALAGMVALAISVSRSDPAESESASEGDLG